MEHEQEEQMDVTKSAEPKEESVVRTTASIKQEYLQKRQEEIALYYQELAQFCQERNIELGAELVDGENGRRFNVFIIDRQ